MLLPSLFQLQEFYRTPYGKQVYQAITYYLENYWSAIKGEMILGIGFPFPFLVPFLSPVNHVHAMLPARMGMMHWPEGQPNHCFTGDEALLPLPHNSISRIVMVHLLEYTESPAELLKEAWRVLAPEGRLLIIVPNYFGAWARTSDTPFYTGNHFISWKLHHLLEKADFTLQSSRSILFSPPSKRDFIQRNALLWEKGGRLLSCCGGLLAIEAQKRLYSMTACGERKRRNAVPLYMPAPSVVRKSAHSSLRKNARGFSL